MTDLRLLNDLITAQATAVASGRISYTFRTGDEAPELGERKPIVGGSLEEQVCEAEAWLQYLTEMILALGSSDPQAAADKAYEKYCRAREECIDGAAP